MYINWNSLWNSQIIHIWKKYYTLRNVYNKHTVHPTHAQTMANYGKTMAYLLSNQVKTYEHTTENNAIWLATLLAIYSWIYIEERQGWIFFCFFSDNKTNKKQCVFLIFLCNFEECNEHKFVFTKTIRLLGFDFYDAIVIYHFIEISSS